MSGEAKEAKVRHPKLDSLVAVTANGMTVSGATFRAGQTFRVARIFTVFDRGCAECRLALKCIESGEIVISQIRVDQVEVLG